MFDNLYVIVVFALFVFFGAAIVLSFVKKRLDVKHNRDYDELDHHAAGNFNMQFFQK